VETRKEFEFLRARQCDEAQGFYFSRPVPPMHFAELLRTGVARSKDVPSGSIVPETGSAGMLNARHGVKAGGQRK
jgi:hypothetical protein